MWLHSRFVSNYFTILTNTYLYNQQDTRQLLQKYAKLILCFFLRTV